MAIVQPVQFSGNPAQAPFLLLPDAGVLFARRARRLKLLAHGHAMAEYLGFLAEVAAAQQQALDLFPPVGLPAVGTAQPPLAVGSFKPDVAWQGALYRIVGQVATHAPPGFSARLKDSLASTGAADLDEWAQAYIRKDFAHRDLGVMSLVAAGLQVYWTALTRAQDFTPAASGGPHAANLCPACGDLPVGSIVSAKAATRGLRYLQCSMCASQWNLERIRCVNCGDNKHLAYYSLEGTGDAVQAEACDACHVYSKIMHVEKTPDVDIVADDLATVALDVLMDEAGYRRYGLNPFLLTGS